MMRRTVEIARGGPRPTIRLRRVPPCEPPYDDEREQPFWPIANQLALDWPPAARPQAAARPDIAAGTVVGPGPTEANPAGANPTGSGSAGANPAGASPTRSGSAGSGLPSTGPGSAALRQPDPTGAPGQTTSTEAPDWPGAGGSRLISAAAAASSRVSGDTLTLAAAARTRPVMAAGASTDAKVAVHRFVRLCVEVLNGYRPAAHLRRYSLPGEAAGVVAQGLAAAQRVASLRKAAQAPGRRPARRPSPAAVVRLRLCEPRPGAVEAAVALVTGERTWALALRLELHEDTWSATALRLI